MTRDASVPAARADLLADLASSPPVIGTERIAVGVDFDGTVADTIGAAFRWCREVLKRPLPESERRFPPGRAVLGPELYDRMLLDRAFLEMLEPTPGAIEALSRLSATADVYIVTARNSVQAEGIHRWLQHRALALPLVATAYQSKLAVCAELKLRWLLDDSFDHTADLAGHVDTELVLIEMPWNRSTLIDARGVRVVRDWAGYVELVQGPGPDRES